MEVSINMSDRDLKKTKIQPLNNKRKKIPILKIVLGVILTAVITAGGYLLYKGYKVSDDIGFQFEPGKILQPEKKPELKKDSTGKYTSVMIVGVDTRETGNLMNTDSIIVATYSYDTKDLSMISIPRDFFVRIYPNKTGKINSVYASHEQKTKGSGMEALKNVIEEMTDIEIQYHVMIDYKAFVQLIDAVGGVTVNVENSFTDKCYPSTRGTPGSYSAYCIDSAGWWETVSFTAGPTEMDGQTALKFSRSRHSSQNSEGTDFARARRQQRVIAALRDEVLSSETLLNPKKVMDLMSAVQNNIKISEFTIDDVQAGINILKDFQKSNGNTYSFVLDPTSGGSSLIKSQNGEGYIILPIEGQGKYTKIKDYVTLLLKNPKLYSENPTVYVYNAGLGYQAVYEKTQELREEFKYINIKYLGNLYSDKQGVYVYSNKDNEFKYSTDQLSKYIKPTSTSKPEFITNNLKGEDISILFGKPTETNIQTSSL